MNLVRNSLLIAMTLVMALGLVLLPSIPAEAQTLQQTNAQVRVVHASPNAPAVDVYINEGGTPLATNLSFFQATGYLSVPTPVTITSVQFYLAGADPTSEEPAVNLTGLSVSLSAGTAYTVAAVGLLGDTVPPGQEFTVALFEDDLSAPAEGQSRARIYHLSPDAPEVIVQADGQDLARELAYGEASAYTEVPAGIYDLAVSSVDDPLTAVLTVNGYVLRAGKTYDIFAVGLLAGTPALNVEVVVVASTARVRVAHVSPDAPPVDIYLNESSEPALTNLPYTGITDYLDVPISTTSVQVRAAGADPSSPPVFSGPAELEPGEAYTLAALGLLEDNSLTVTGFVDDLTAPTTGQAKVRFFHGNPGLDPVGVKVEGASDNLVNSLAFGNASAYIEVPADTYTLELFPAAAPTLIAASLPNVEFQAGLIYDIFAVGAGLETLAIQSKITETNAKLRLAHASPDTPPVDIYLDGGATAVATAVPYFTLSEYLSIPVGTRSVEIRVAGADPSSDPVLQATFVAKAAKAYTIVARGFLAEGTPSDQQLALSFYEDDLSMPMMGQARVRAFHLSPDAPAVDVRVAGTTTPLIDGLAFTEDASILVPAGIYDLEVTTDDGASVVTTISGFEARPGQIYEVFAIGEVASLELRNNVIDTAARVTFVHAALGVGPVDVYVNREPLILGADFFSRSSLLWLPPGIAYIEVFAAGTDISAPGASAVLSAGFTLLPGQAYTIVAQGDAAATVQNAPGLAIYNATLSSPPAGQASVSVYHLSPDAPVVDIRVQGETTPLFDNLAFGQSATQNVPAGTYTLEITSEDGSTVIQTLPGVVFEAGLLYNVYATNNAASLTVETGVQFPEDIVLVRVRLPIVAATPPEF